MLEYLFKKMNDYSNQQIDQIRALEQLCKTSDNSSLRVGIESLKEINGDEGFLCHLGNQLIGFLSWYTSDGIEANINAMVHPDFRRQGVFQGLLSRAASDMQIHGIQTCRFRIPSDSEPGIHCIQHMGANFATDEFSMILNQEHKVASSPSGLVLRLEEEQDLEFMVNCLSQAFGDSASWTMNYLARTREPARMTYIAMDHLRPIGMIRVNVLDTDIAVIHDFCVLPSCQGRGYGRKILSGVVEILLDRKSNQVRLGVVTHNRNALNLYLSSGFEVSAESHYYLISISRIN